MVGWVGWVGGGFGCCACEGWDVKIFYFRNTHPPLGMMGMDGWAWAEGHGHDGWVSWVAPHMCFKHIYIDFC